MIIAQNVDIGNVILHFYNNGDIKRIVNNITISNNPESNKELRMDLEHDIVEILLKDPQKTISIYNRGKLGVYISGLAKRMVYCSNSTYNKQIVRYEKRRVGIEEIL